MRVGEENDGWRMFTSQINRERVALAPSAEMFRTLDTVVEWAKSTTRSDGTRVADVDWIAMALGRMRAKIEVARLFNWRMAWHTEIGGINPAEASVMKVYVTELEGELQRTLLNIVGAEGIIPVGTQGAVLDGLLEQGYRGPALINTFGGGTNEIQREIIATSGLHTPRAPR